MPGQATVTIDGSIWSVSVMTTSAELIAGLSGVANIPANTGMLFDMGSDQDSIEISTTEMLFSLDIIFINSAGVVVGVLSEIEPGEGAAFSADGGLGAQYFLEVNAEEAENVNIGDNVDISGYAPPTGIDLNQMMQMVVIIGMMGIAMKTMGKPLKAPVERPLIYGPKGEVLTSHSIHGPERVRLVEKYGTWAVGRAESVCPEGDVACVEKEAGKLIYAYRRSFTG